MKPTRSNKRLSNHQRLEIIPKLQKPQKPNPPSKRAILHAYCVSESAIRKLWGQKDSIFKCTELVPESTRISAFCVSQACFPELEDQFFLWVDTMRHLKLASEYQK